jgi:glycosyltransferase involved in cell wall biosynthesis
LVISRSNAARVPLDEAGGNLGERRASTAAAGAPSAPLTVLIVAPTLDAGAADAGALTLTRILVGAGHRVIVVSRGGRLEGQVTRAGAEFVRRDLASKNPLLIARNALALRRLAQECRCDVIHAHGRTAAWSAYFAAQLTGATFLTSWYKGFREQNALKHAYNAIMARGQRVIAVSEQIAELVHDRHGTPWSCISIVPPTIDPLQFDPTRITTDRIEALRGAWGVKPQTKVILVVGRMLRRKGHHVVVKAVARLRSRGLKDFLCVFAGEDHGHTRYTGELWDLIHSTETADVVRLAGAVEDMAAAYALATVVVCAAIQPDGLPRALLEAQAMARPIIVSDVTASSEVVLAPPTVPDDRMTGLRVPAGDDAALAAALFRVFSLPDSARLAVGERGRAWVSAHFNPTAVGEQTLAVYDEIRPTRG